MLTPDQIQSFDKEGFVLVEDVFSPQEIAILLTHAEVDKRIEERKSNLPDAEGRSSKLALWMDVRDDVWGAVTSSRRIVDSVRALLRDDIYHWHSKVMLKESRVGGAWERHQDYGYWYDNKCLYPHLCSALLALNPATKENGCLKVVVGSHHLGRINHGERGNQTGADPERLRAIEERLPVRWVEAPAGSVLFFHCNTLHSSEPNLSASPRTSYICCYNAFSNIPYGGGGHGKPEPINLVSDDAVLRFGEGADVTEELVR